MLHVVDRMQESFLIDMFKGAFHRCDLFASQINAAM